MKSTTIWPINTVPSLLIEKLLNFYKSQSPTDPYYDKVDLRGTIPQPSHIPELYEFIESLGYKIDFHYKILGNYLETNICYPIHVDTGKIGTSQPYDTNYMIFLIPLHVPENCNSYLFLLDQEWYGEASTFMVQNWKKGWNNMINDYSNQPIQNYNLEPWDTRLNNLNVILTEETLQGMSAHLIYKWKTSSMISFPCTQMHFSTTDSKDFKIGLSLRLRLIR
jgi:hypothetical protein